MTLYFFPEYTLNSQLRQYYKEGTLFKIWELDVSYSVKKD